MNKWVIFSAAGLLLAGCAQTIAESRVRSAFVDAGLSDTQSACMAERMVDRLTIDQLRKLEGLKPRAGEPRRPETMSGYLARVRRVGDAEVIAVTTTSAALCAAGLADEARPR